MANPSRCNRPPGRCETCLAAQQLQFFEVEISHSFNFCMASYVRTLVTNARVVPFGSGDCLAMYRLKRSDQPLSKLDVRSDNEAKVCGIAGNNGRAWFSILPVSASRLGFRARSFGSLHSSYIPWAQPICWCCHNRKMLSKALS